MSRHVMAVETGGDAAFLYSPYPKEKNKKTKCKTYPSATRRVTLHDNVTYHTTLRKTLTGGGYHATGILMRGSITKYDFYPMKAEFKQSGARHRTSRGPCVYLRVCTAHSPNCVGYIRCVFLPGQSSNRLKETQP